MQKSAKCLKARDQQFFGFGRMVLYPRTVQEPAKPCPLENDNP